MRAVTARNSVLIFVIAGLALGSVVFPMGASAASKPEPHQLTILFTGDDQGNIKPPCG